MENNFKRVVPCNCGDMKIEDVGDVTYSVFGRKITIKNIPHFFCENCGSISHADDNSIKEFLTTAYDNQYDTIFWTDIVQ